jgi:hypothetical protein
LSFAVGAGADPAVVKPVQSITWTAQPVDGLTLTPASGTAPVVDGVAKVNVSVTASATVRQGFRSMSLALTAPGVTLPRVEFPVAVIGAGKTAKVCTTLGPTNTEHALAQRELAGDGVTAPVNAGGQDARQTVLRVPNNLNMYFRVDRQIAFDGTFSATFDITYFDSGTNGWTLQYDSATEPYKGAATIVNTGTNTWKTATITVDDARFAERENEQTDFRIASGTPVTIHSVQTSITGDGVLPMDLCS